MDSIVTTSNLGNDLINSGGTIKKTRKDIEEKEVVKKIKFTYNDSDEKKLITQMSILKNKIKEDNLNASISPIIKEKEFSYFLIFLYRESDKEKIYKYLDKEATINVLQEKFMKKLDKEIEKLLKENIERDDHFSVEIPSIVPISSQIKNQIDSGLVDLFTRIDGKELTMQTQQLIREILKTPNLRKCMSIEKLRFHMFYRLMYLLTEKFYNPKDQLVFEEIENKSIKIGGFEFKNDSAEKVSGDQQYSKLIPQLKKEKSYTGIRIIAPLFAKENGVLYGIDHDYVVVGDLEKNASVYYKPLWMIRPSLDFEKLLKGDELMLKSYEKVLTSLKSMMKQNNTIQQLAKAGFSRKSLNKKGYGI